MLINGNDLLDVANANNFAVPAFNISDWAMLQRHLRDQRGEAGPADHRDPPGRARAHRRRPDARHHRSARTARRCRSPSTSTTAPTYDQMLLAIQHGLHVGHDRRLAAAVRRERRAHQAVPSRPRTPSGSRSRASSARSARPTARPRTVRTRSSTPTRTTPCRFVQETGVDSLAVAIGTCHGLYPAWMKPELKLDLLERDQGRGRASRWCCTAVPATRTSRSASRSSSASTRSTSPATSRSPTTARCARCSQRPQAARAERRSSPPRVAAMKVTAAQKIDLFDAAGKADLY